MQHLPKGRKAELQALRHNFKDRTRITEQRQVSIPSGWTDKDSLRHLFEDPRNGTL
jgi:hypothetical protein